MCQGGSNTGRQTMVAALHEGRHWATNMCITDFLRSSGGSTLLFHRSWLPNVVLIHTINHHETVCLIGHCEARSGNAQHASTRSIDPSLLPEAPEPIWRLNPGTQDATSP